MSFKKKMALLFIGLFSIVFLTLNVINLIDNTIFANEEDTYDVDPELSIYGKNVSYDSELYILYAVDYNKDFDYDKYPIKMLFYSTLKDDYTVDSADSIVDANGLMSIQGTKYMIFYSPGIPAKKMIDDIYSRCYVDVNGKEYYSEMTKFSILEYVYGMREGELTETQIHMLDDMLSYGGSAQMLLNYKKDFLASDTYYKIEVDGGWLSDGFQNGLYKSGTLFTIYAPEHGFKYWLTNYGQKIKSNTYTLLAERNTKFTAVYSTGEKEIEELKLDLPYDFDDRAYAMSNNYELNDADLWHRKDLFDRIAPQTIWLSDGIDSIDANVTWDISSLDPIKIGVQKIQGTLKDQKLYNEYNVREDEIVMEVNILPFKFNHSIESFEWMTDDEELAIREYHGNYMKLELPSSFNGHLITGFEMDFNPEFMYGFKDHNELMELTIPTTYKNLPIELFANCKNLTSVTLNEGLQDIDSRVFYGCESLKGINLPNSLERIGSQAFAYSGLETISIPDNVEMINMEAFMECENLVIVELQDNLTDIQDRAFANCRKLQNINLDNVLRIGNQAFYNCVMLNAKIPTNLEYLGGMAFKGNMIIRNVVIPASLTEIGVAPFAYCNLDSIYVSEFNEKFDSRDMCNAIINKEYNIIIQGCKNTIIPEFVDVGLDAFMGIDTYSVNLPDDYYTEGIDEHIYYVTESGIKYYVQDETYYVVGIEYGFNEWGEIKETEAIRKYDIWMDEYYPHYAYPTTDTKPLYYIVVLPDRIDGHEYVISSEAFRNDMYLMGICLEWEPHYNNRIEYGAFYGCINLRRIVYRYDIREFNRYISEWYSNEPIDIYDFDRMTRDRLLSLLCYDIYSPSFYDNSFDIKVCKAKEQDEISEYSVESDYMIYDLSQISSDKVVYIVTNDDYNYHNVGNRASEYKDHLGDCNDTNLDHYKNYHRTCERFYGYPQDVFRVDNFNSYSDGYEAVFVVNRRNNTAFIGVNNLDHPLDWITIA